LDRKGRHLAPIYASRKVFWLAWLSGPGGFAPVAPGAVPAFHALQSGVAVPVSIFRVRKNRSVLKLRVHDRENKVPKSTGRLEILR